MLKDGKWKMENGKWKKKVLVYGVWVMGGLNRMDNP